MKESVFSIRAYFGLIGAFGLIRGVSGIIVAMEEPAVIIPAAISLFFGLGFLYSAIRFPMLLKTSTRIVKILLYAMGGINAINGVLLLLSGIYGSELIVSIVMIVIAWYLLLNVKRLKTENFPLLTLDPSNEPTEQD
jgi:hypothetical protein